MLFSLLLAAFAATQPTTQPNWTDTESGRRILRPFDSAPYPHASRKDGYKSGDAVYNAAEHYSDPTVGIFVPAGYVPGETVDYVVHFHGHKNHVERVFERFKLTEQMAASKVNAILIVPQGPKDVPDSGGGKLEHDRDGLKRLLDDVSTYLQSEHVVQTNRLGKVVISAHSGGYLLAASVLDHGGVADHVTDVLLFDASYGNLAMFNAFASAHHEARVVSFHTKHLDARNDQLKTLLEKSKTPFRDVVEAQLNAETAAGKGVVFVATTNAHDAVPSYLQLMLETSALRKQ